MRAAARAIAPRADLARVPVVRGGLAVGVEQRGGVARLLQRAHRAITDRGELFNREPSLASQRRGAAVVLGEQRHHLVAAVAGALLEEGADLVVLSRAHRLGQHPVGHVADQHVLEGQLALAGQPALGAGGEDVLVLEREQHRRQVAALGLGQGGE